MKVALFSNDIELLQRWGKLLPTHKTEIVEDINDVLALKNSLLIFNNDASNGNHHLLVSTLLKNSNKILVLDRVPELSKAKSWLEKGVHGYGNAIMTTSYINSAVESILSHHIWILPQITTQLLQRNMETSTDNSEAVFQTLTSKEREIALLLKEGYLNGDIANELSISVNTVKAHVKKIYLKLGVNNRIAFGLLFSK